MPTYDYACTACPHTFQHFQSMTSDLLTECPECQGKLKRLIGSGGALIFKGTGFYCTDYKKPKKSSSSGTSAGSTTAASTSDSSGSSDSSPSDSSSNSSSSNSSSDGGSSSSGSDTSAA